ncbi:cytochrome D ubiquinol oxidase subunit I [Proteus mirabilis]|uniref:Cytochrome D ubiquinol oxidase subunit I n=1 Tax=Proteus mirabilis TaxID=584 RepID=A0A379FHD3_PROMI|nr:cytochrome D ubiquinol oxidase subunit I [Proteus mirabilis]
MSQHEVRIRNGMKAYDLLTELRSGNTDLPYELHLMSLKKT